MAIVAWCLMSISLNTINRTEPHRTDWSPSRSIPTFCWWQIFGQNSINSILRYEIRHFVIRHIRPIALDSLKASINSLAGHCSRPKDHVSNSQCTNDSCHCRKIPIIFLINIPITFDTTLSIQAFPFRRLFSKHLIASGMESIDSTTKTRQTTDSGRSKTVTTMTTTMQRANQNEDKQNQRGKYLHFFSSFLSSPSTLLLLLLFIEIHSLRWNTKYTTPTEWQESTTVLIEMLAVIRNRRRRMVRSPKVKWKLTRGKNRMGTKRRQMEKQMLTTTTSMMVSARWWSIESWERERSNERVRERKRSSGFECVCVCFAASYSWHHDHHCHHRRHRRHRRHHQRHRVLWVQLSWICWMNGMSETEYSNVSVGTFVASHEWEVPFERSTETCTYGPVTVVVVQCCRWNSNNCNWN